MERWAIFSTIGILGLGTLVAWREWTHGQEHGQWQSEATRLQSELADKTVATDQASSRVVALERILEENTITEQSLRDRLGNLEAQREHLRAEVDRQIQRAESAESGIEIARSELETVRQSLLEQSILPRQLKGQLKQARNRLEELESELDGTTAQQAVGPDLLTVDGISDDHSVFSLVGGLPVTESLPLPIYLCQNDDVLLTGWIHRTENRVAIGHVEEWREPASKLVKGEKVFIVRRLSHEALP